MTLPLSVCMVVRDEATLLPMSLAPVRDLATEVVVVDAGSTDGTPQVAESSGARVVTAPAPMDFAQARNLALETATQPWILMLDADEVLTPEAVAELTANFANLNPHTVYCLPIISPNGDQTFRPALFARSPELRYDGRVAEELRPSSADYRLAIVPGMPVQHRFDARDPAALAARRQQLVGLLNDLIEQEPGRVSALLKLAELQLQLAQYPEALALAESAVTNAADDSVRLVPAHLAAAIAHYRMGSWQEVIDQAEAGLKHHGEFPEFHALIGLAAQELGNLDRAEQALASAAFFSRTGTDALVPKRAWLRTPTLYAAMGANYLKQGKTVPGALCRRLSEAQNPEQAAAVLATEFSALMNRQEWTSALWLVSLFFPVTLVADGKALHALLLSQRESDRLVAQADLWGALRAFGREDERQENLLKQVKEQFPLDIRPLQRLGQLALDKEQWALAIEYLDRAVFIEPQSGWAWGALGVACAMSGDAARAKTCFDEVLKVGSPQEIEGAKQNLARLAAEVSI